MKKNAGIRICSKETMQNRGIPLLIILVIFCILLYKYGFRFSTNDDCLLEALLSGAYSGTPEAHDVYHMYPLAWIIAFFYRIFPSVPWYGVFLCLAQFTSIYLCMVRCSEMVTGMLKKAVISVLFAVFYVGIMLPETVLLQYTVTSAMMGATAVFLLVTDRREEADWKSFFVHRLPGVILYCGAFALRRQIGLFFLPFLGGACLYKWLFDEAEKSKPKILMGYGIALLLVGITAIFRFEVLFYITVGAAVAVSLWTVVISAKGRKKQLFRYVGLVTCLFGFMGSLWAIDEIAYSSSDWKAFRIFNEIRTDIYDFGDIPVYQDNEQMYTDAGLTEGDQILLRKYNMILSDRINTDSLQVVDDYQKQIYGADYSVANVKKVIEYAIRRIVRNIDLPYAIILFGLYIILCMLFLLTKRYSGLLVLVYIVALRVACWSYLYLQNRFPERVTHGLYLVEILLLLGICIRQLQCLENKAKNVYGYILETICLVSGICCLSYSVSELSSGEEYRDKILYNNWEMVRTYCKENTDKFYLLDTLSFANYTQDIFAQNNAYQNYTLCGGWGVNTPAFYRKLEKFDVGPTINQALKKGKTLYFIQQEKNYIDRPDTYWLNEYENASVIPVEELLSEDSKYIVYKINLKTS